MKVNESLAQIVRTKIHSHCRVKHKDNAITPARTTSLKEVKVRPQEKLNTDLCDTGAALHQLSYLANWAHT